MTSNPAKYLLKEAQRWTARLADHMAKATD
jgi:hypothetical protein